MFRNWIKIGEVMSKPSGPKDIDEYIAGFPGDIQVILEKVRAIIREAAPEAKETIKYQMPTFTLNGNLVHFAAFKNHIGLYPIPSGNEQFNNELSAYVSGKGSIRFPIDEPIPYDLISQMVAYRVKINLEKVKTKGKSNP